MDNEIDVTDETENVGSQNGSSAIIPEGTVLNSNWLIGKQVGSTEHANIYSVTRECRDDDKSDINYEARSYDFDDIPPHVKSNRARAIRRLSGRTAFNMTWNHLRVIVYRTGIHQQVQKETNKAFSEEHPTTKSVCKSSKQKTTRQQESDRLRQRSRRRRARQERKQSTLQDENEQSQDYQSHKGPKIESAKPVEVDAAEFCFFELLYLINGDETIRQKVAPATRSKVEDYLAAKDKEVDIDGEEALVDFIAIKEREIVFLQRTNNKFQPVLKNWNEYLDEVTRQALRNFGTDPPKRQDNQDNDLQIFRMRYKILKEGLEALPDLVEEAEEKVRKLQLKLCDVRQAREEREAKQAVKLEKKKLSKQIRNLEKWVANVTPGSASYYKIAEDIISAERELEGLRLNDDG
ncbi:hypothetical protein FANTH_1424 [Fusarium anthophilum]|uniref:Uncharacterized protein n=1 Tax=Fusarium anthophilum TaxID=48485 RepID=A0A8H5EBD2_9HYPO|nr:hypothetical protein FANTH_1424 [Fusarium anthophilum]